MKQHFMMFAAYNQWANGRIYDAAADLDEEEFNRDVGAFLRLADGHAQPPARCRIAPVWMKRFTGEGDAPDGLVGHPATVAFADS